MKNQKLTSSDVAFVLGWLCKKQGTTINMVLALKPQSHNDGRFDPEGFGSMNPDEVRVISADAATLPTIRARAMRFGLHTSKRGNSLIVSHSENAVSLERHRGKFKFNEVAPGDTRGFHRLPGRELEYAQNEAKKEGMDYATWEGEHYFYKRRESEAPLDAKAIKEFCAKEKIMGRIDIRNGRYFQIIPISNGRLKIADDGKTLLPE